MDIFQKYVSRRIYKSLAIIDFVNEDYWQHDLNTLLDNEFSNFECYEDAVERLSLILSVKGLKTFRSRYAKFKSAHKRRTDKKIVEVSQDILEKITQSMALTGAETYDELFERLLDKTDHKINQILSELEIEPNFKQVYDALPLNIQKNIGTKIDSAFINGFSAGVNAVPIDLRKKSKLEVNTESVLEESLEKFRREN